MTEVMNYDLVIQNTTVATYTHQGYVEQICNIGVKDGLIAAIGTQSLQGTTVVDGKNLVTLPGVIDSQVHFRDPGMTHKEDIETGTRSAALGGVTSIFEMPNTIPPTTTADLLNQKFTNAQGKSWVNHAFFIGASTENISELARLELLEGCPGIKIFMGSSTGNLLVENDSDLEKIFRSGHRRVIIHSEDEFRLRERKKIATDSQDVKNHHVWRDAESALLSTQRLLRISKLTGRKVHVLHVTTAEEMELLSHHQQNASVEVLPQHLTLSAPECYERLGTFAQQNPPIREKHHQEALWRGISNGTVKIIGSDHAPHTREEKLRTYPQTPSGVPGVQTLVPIMLDHVHQGRLSLQKLIELVCENPRWVFGCESKGRIEVGRDADFTLVDLKARRKIENSWIASRAAWTPFDGMSVTGWPVVTIVGGNLVMKNDTLLGSPIGRKVKFTQT